MPNKTLHFHDFNWCDCRRYIRMFFLASSSDQAKVNWSIMPNKLPVAYFIPLVPLFTTDKTQYIAFKKVLRINHHLKMSMEKKEASLG